jgi:hypothetical protein
MARDWLTIEVELVSGRGEYHWPRPGRLMVASPRHSFRQLARAINVAFARWELAHLHRFVLEDGTEILPLDWWDDAPLGAVDDTSPLSLLGRGTRFAYEFDMGDGWEHACTVGPDLVGPEEVYGEEPDAPAVYFGWGTIPDQHGRRWADDDGYETPPPQPEPPTSDLPPVLPHWGDWPIPPVVAEGAVGDVIPLLSMGEWDEAAWRALNGAIARGDGQAVVEVLLRRDPAEYAQTAGEGLLIALAQGIGAAYTIAGRLADEIRDRHLPGDAALADELDAVLGVGAEPDLRPIPVDLDELSTHLEGTGLGDDGWRLDVETGELWPDDPVGLVGVEPPDGWEDHERWLAIWPLGSRDAWHDMGDFIELVEDGELADRLERAIHGRGAFRHFKDVLAEHGDLLHVWFRFADDRKRGRARAWLEGQGHRAVPPSSWPGTA